MSSVEDRLRRLADAEAIRTPDAVSCRLLDDGDGPALVEPSTPGGVLDGLRRVEGRADLLAYFSEPAPAGLTASWHDVTDLEVAVGTDTATVRSPLRQPRVVDGVPHVAAGRYADERVRFPYRAPLTDGWDAGRYEFVNAVPPEVRA